MASGNKTVKLLTCFYAKEMRRLLGRMESAFTLATWKDSDDVSEYWDLPTCLTNGGGYLGRGWGGLWLQRNAISFAWHCCKLFRRNLRIASLFVHPVNTLASQPMKTFILNSSESEIDCSERVKGSAESVNYCWNKINSSKSVYEAESPPIFNECSLPVFSSQLWFWPVPQETCVSRVYINFLLFQKVENDVVI